MDNQIFGFITITLCALGYYFSWSYLKKDNINIALLLLMICGLALRFYTSTDFFLHTWDERYHALVAKNLMKHPLIPTLYENPLLPYDFKNWTGNHIWVHKQPMALWSMAASMHIFGVNEIALRLPSIILSTLGIWLTSIIGCYFFNKKIGYLAAFLFSVNGLIIELTGGRVPTDHIDIFFLFFIELAIVFSILFVQKKRTIFNILAGMSIGAAILSKWLPALIVLPIWLLLVVDSGKFNIKHAFLQFSILLITCILVFLPWQIYIFKAFPLEASWEASYNFKHISEAVEGRRESLFYFINRIRISYGELIYLPMIWFLYKTFRNYKDKKRLAIIIWFYVPLIFFSIARTKMQGYILFASPALFLMTSEFFFFLADYRKDRKLKWLYNLVLISLIALPINYMIERVKPFSNRERNPEWVKELKKLNSKEIENGVMFNYDHAIEAMFYTDLTVFRRLPDQRILGDLIKQGFTVIINDNGNIPDKDKLPDGVIIENISGSQ